MVTSRNQSESPLKSVRTTRPCRGTRTRGTACCGRSPTGSTTACQSRRYVTLITQVVCTQFEIPSLYRSQDEDADNRTERTHGDVEGRKKYSHVDLIHMIGGMDAERGTVTAGGRGYYLMVRLTFRKPTSAMISVFGVSTPKSQYALCTMQSSYVYSYKNSCRKYYNNLSCH